MKRRLILLVTVLLGLVGFIILRHVRQDQRQRSQLEITNRAGLPLSLSCGERSVTLLPGQVWVFDYRLWDSLRAQATLGGVTLLRTNLLHFSGYDVAPRAKGEIYLVHEVTDKTGRITQYSVIQTDDVSESPQQDRTRTSLLIDVRPIPIGQ